MAHFGKHTTPEALEPANPDEGIETAGIGEEMVMVRAPHSPQAEQFRRMRNAIQALNPDGAARSILLTSAIEGEGKTVTALNLGLALCELPHLRVCVIDGNRFHPSFEAYMGVPRKQGLGELLAGSLKIEQAIRRTSIERFDLIGAGAQTTDPVLNVERMRSVLHQLKRRYDYVLLDASPVLRASHPSLLASIADGILLVVRIGMTPKHLVEEAYTMLENLGGNVLGTCATGCSEE